MQPQKFAKPKEKLKLDSDPHQPSQNFTLKTQIEVPSVETIATLIPYNSFKRPSFYIRYKPLEIPIHYEITENDVAFCKKIYKSDYKEKLEKFRRVVEL